MPPRRVLVVDDEAMLRNAVALALQMEGYHVNTAANGAEALTVLSHVQPDCVLLDMRMPVLDGWGFARELARRQLRIPLVVMTAAVQTQRWAEDIQAAGWVAKPFTLDELLHMVEQVCGEAGTAAR